MGTSIPAKDIGLWFDYNNELIVYKKDNEYLYKDSRTPIPDITGFLEIKKDSDKNFVIQYQYIDFKDKNLYNLKKKLIEFKYNKLWIYDDKFIKKKDKEITFEESNDGTMYINSSINIKYIHTNLNEFLEVKYDYKNKVFVVKKDNHTIFGKNIIELKRNLNKFIQLYKRIKEILTDKTRLLENISDIEINAIELNPEIFEEIDMSLKNKKRVISKLHENKERRNFEFRKAEIEEFNKEFDKKGISYNKTTKLSRAMTSKLEKLCKIEGIIYNLKNVGKYNRKNTRKYNNSKGVSIDKKYYDIGVCKKYYDNINNKSVIPNLTPPTPTAQNPTLKYSSLWERNQATVQAAQDALKNYPIVNEI